MLGSQHMAVDSPLSEPPEDMRQPPWPLTKLPALQQNRDPENELDVRTLGSRLRATPHTYCLLRARLARREASARRAPVTRTTSPQAIVTQHTHLGRGRLRPI
ncbi:hypothetical protein GWI33_000220 [Rhynchophorus ferrugineus]|uniref:Uncharacterized protein n=1 Tax=Rhynchophorus ferrugineus TaxID=354439 RepID=A0A834IYK5_RHYFE|nr:hypothetical protein GWI33_000220 [Rhynchophorus ferrugineus]